MEKTIKDLGNLYKDIRAKEKIEIHLKNIDRLLLEQEKEEKRTAAQMLKEDADVKRLEKQSLFNIFKAMLGTKEQQLEKERQEYLQAFLVHKASQKALVELKKERDLLLKVYSSKFNVEENFDQLLSSALAKIQSRWPDLAKDIQYFEESISNHKSKIAEINQAQKEGKKTIRMLQRISIELANLESWGNTNSRKSKTNYNRSKSKIQRTIHTANNHLQRFEKELFDISDHYGLDYTAQVNEIKDFINHLFDSLITDWIVQKAIANSANVINNLSDKITRIVAMLDQHIIATRGFIKLEEKDKRQLVSKVLKKK